MAKAQLKEDVKETTPLPAASSVPTVVSAERALPAELQVPDDAAFAELSGLGNEQVTRDDLATPFLFILQDLSPQVKRTEAKYVEGAQAGMFFNSVTRQLYDGALGLEIIDCYFEPLLTKWTPRDKGGGFKGVVEPSDPILKRCRNKVRDGKETQTLITPDGDEINNINQHYLLVRPYTKDAALNPYPWQPVCLGLGSTQIKKSKQLNAQLNLERVRTADGRIVPIPRFGVVWRLATVPERNQTGSWFGIQFERLRRVNAAELQEGVAFYKAVSSGERRVKPSEETHPPAEDAGRGPPSSNGDPGPGLEDQIPY